MKCMVENFAAVRTPHERSTLGPAAEGMSPVAQQPALPPDLFLHPSRLALFLDVDGTLAPFTARPEMSRIPCATRKLLKRLQSQGVALAVLSGRPLAQVRRLLHPVDIPIVGSHGGQLGLQPGRIVRSSPLLPSHLAGRLENGVSTLPGVWVEKKPGAVAVHWRQAPEVRWTIAELVQQAVQQAPGWAVMEGHCVHEIKAKGRHKGLGLRRLMNQPAFRGRWPLAVGDDRTDEDAFVAACGLGGAAIRIGEPAETHAPWQLPDVASLAIWLERQLRRIEVRRVSRSTQLITKHAGNGFGSKSKEGEYGTA